MQHNAAQHSLTQLRTYHHHITYHTTPQHPTY